MFWFVFLLLLTQCSDFNPQPNPPNLTFSGRLTPALYRIYAPDGWEVVEDPYQSDTTLPILTLKKEGITLVVHNFPGMTIPPQAQVARWQKQLSEPGDVTTLSLSGYEGLKLEGKQTYAWALQLSPEWNVTDERKSPVTIKVSGPEESLKALTAEINAIATSFELEQPL